MKEKSSITRLTETVVLDFLLLTSWAVPYWRRQKIRERDGNVCQFPVPNHRCNGNENIPVEKRRLQINHVFPRKYLKMFGVEPDETPELLITICENSHVGDPGIRQGILPVHPDIHEAHERYRRGDKQAIAKAVQEQEEKCAERTVFWNDKYDRAMLTRAVKNTQQMDKKMGGRSNWWDKKRK